MPDVAAGACAFVSLRVTETGFLGGRNIVVHQLKFLKTALGNLEIIFPVRRDFVSQLRIEHIHVVFGYFHFGGDVGQFHHFADLHRFIVHQRVRRGLQLKAVFGRIFDDMQCGEKTGNVAGRLMRQPGIQIPEAVEVIDVLAGNDAQDPAFAAVVSGQHGEPVAEHRVQLLQISNGRPRGFQDVHAFIHPFVPRQPEFVTRGRNKLPQSQSPRGGIRADLESAFHQGKPEEFLGDARFFQFGNDELPV